MVTVSTSYRWIALRSLETRCTSVHTDEVQLHIDRYVVRESATTDRLVILPTYGGQPELTDYMMEDHHPFQLQTGLMS